MWFVSIRWAANRRPARATEQQARATMTTRKLSPYRPRRDHRWRWRPHRPSPHRVGRRTSTGSRILATSRSFEVAGIASKEHDEDRTRSSRPPSARGRPESAAAGPRSRIERRTTTDATQIRIALVATAVALAAVSAGGWAAPAQAGITLTGSTDARPHPSPPHRKENHDARQRSKRPRRGPFGACQASRGRRHPRAASQPYRRGSHAAVQASRFPRRGPAGAGGASAAGTASAATAIEYGLIAAFFGR